jgi:hypothetical protein
MNLCESGTLDYNFARFSILPPCVTHAPPILGMEFDSVGLAGQVQKGAFAAHNGFNL